MSKQTIQSALLKQPWAPKWRMLTLAEIEKKIRAHEGVSSEHAATVMAILKDRIKKIGAIHLLSGDPPEDGETPSSAPGLRLLPPWILALLDLLWVSLRYPYVVAFQNDTDLMLDFVLAYETGVGLIDVMQTTVFPWSTGEITCECPCFDMVRYAFSVWTQDDEELGRTSNMTPEEVDAGERLHGTYRACRDSWRIFF